MKQSQADINYTPHAWLKNRHLLTIVSPLLRRGHSIEQASSENLLVRVAEDSSILAQAHINESISSCLVIVHGLEGSSTSPYVLSVTEQALEAGFNVVRMNLRNCGNTLHLTPTLYNAGQSEDLLKVVDWLSKEKKQTKQYIIGFSLGGNLVLKALAEAGSDYPSIKAGSAISPSIDLSASVDCSSAGINRIYEYYFLHSLRKKIVLKHKLFPKLYDINKLKSVHSLRSFDDQFTAPAAGYIDAIHYYTEASAMKLINKIKKNTLIITAQDDPLVPFHSFAGIDNSHVRLLAPKHGGHASFFFNHKFDGSHNNFWAENQTISFCLQQSQLKETVNV